MNESRMLLKKAFLCTFFIALTALLAQVEIPLPYVPISGQTLAVGLTATILGSRLSAISMIVYVALGAVGLPVFAGFDGGLHVLPGPTGGYIFGFIIAAFVTGLILERTEFTVLKAMFANTTGMIIILILGMIQLKLVADLSWTQALASGVFPFILTGILKAFLASYIGIAIRKRLIQADGFIYLNNR